jgi:hypothetical protein
MRHRRQVHAKLLGNGGVRVTAVDLLADELRHFDRGQPMALLVLGDLSIAIDGQVAQDNRHFAQASSNRSAKSLEQIELKVFGFVPRHAHEGIVPLRNDWR